MVLLLLGLIAFGGLPPTVTVAPYFSKAPTLADLTPGGAEASDAGPSPASLVFVEAVLTAAKGSKAKALGLFEASTDHPLLGEVAKAEGASLAYALGDLDKAIALAQGVPPWSPLWGEAALVHGSALCKKGSTKTGRALLLGLALASPGSKQGKRASSRLSSLCGDVSIQGKTSPGCTEPTPKYKITKRALALVPKFRKGGTTDHALLKLVKKLTKKSKLASYKAVKYFLRAEVMNRHPKNRSKALGYYAKALDVAKDPALRAAILLAYAGCLTKADEHEQAAAIIESFIAEFPTHCEVPGLLHDLGNRYYDLGQPDKAAAILTTLVEDHPASDGAAGALFSMAWHAYLAQAHLQALALMGELDARYGGLAIDGYATRHDQAVYWTGRILEHLGDIGGAYEAYADVFTHYPFSTYAMLAAKRLMDLGAAPSTLETMATSYHPVMPPTGDDPVDLILAAPLAPSTATAIELTRLGLSSLAEDYLDDAVTWSGISSLGGDLLLDLKLDRGEPKLSRTFAALRGKGLGYPTALTLDEWKDVYPVSYFDEAVEAATTNGIDPFFLLAVIRTESKFKPKATSRAGAVGLCQLMPSTAKWVAKTMLGWTKKVSTWSLEKPGTNLAIGAAYLRYLADELGGDPLLTAMAYNLGPGQVKGIMEEYPTLAPDELLETITQQGTAAYVKMICHRHATYRSLYDQGQGPARKYGTMEPITTVWPSPPGASQIDAP